MLRIGGLRRLVCMRPQTRLGIVWLLAVAPLFGQDDLVFNSEARLSTVQFQVVQGKNYVGTLKPEDFVLLEDGAPKRITLFESAATKRRAPMEMVLLFDKSGSVTEAGLLNPLVFRDRLLASLPNVKLSVYGFASRLARYSTATRDFAQLSAAFAALGKPKLTGGTPLPIALFPRREKGDGGTWLYEAIAGTVGDVSGKEDGVTRMILVFSDGIGTTTAVPADAAAVCTEAGIPVYAVLLGHRQLRDAYERAEAESARAGFPEPGSAGAGIGNPGGPMGGTTGYKLKLAETSLRAAEAFAGLSELTGGRDFDPPEITLDVMQRILEGMVFYAGTEYVVGFSPEAGDGKPRKHKIEVRLRNAQDGKIEGGSRTAVY